MDEARLKVRFCGPLVSFQDAGRFGMARFGVPASGPMDRLAYAAANAALGYPQTNTVIEVSMGGIDLVCEYGEVSFAVTGGAFQVVHAGAGGHSWCVRTLKAGESLAIRPGHWGSWAYLAFAGELVARKWARHTATHSNSGFGGGALRSGTTLVVREPRVTEDREGYLPEPPNPNGSATARVVLGPQNAHFDESAIQAFCAESYSVTAAYDRMGMRLEGLPLSLKDALSIPSEPIVRGSVQVGGDGVASILLADHQTTGGYPKIATVLSCDTDLVAQLRPKEQLRFQAVSAAKAVELVRAHSQVNNSFLAEVAKPRGGLFQRLMQENLISGMVLDASDPAVL